MSILKVNRKANQTYTLKRASGAAGIALLVYGVCPVFAEEDDLLSSPLFDIEVTNELPTVTSPELERFKNSKDPALIALYALDAKRGSNTHFRAELPTSESISTLAVAQAMTEQSIDVVVEKIRVKDILLEAESLVADDQKLQAIDKLVFELNNVQHPDSKYQINHQIGLVYYGMGKFDKAAEYMEAAVKLNPRDAAITCNLSAIYLYLGKTDEALEALSKVSTKLLIREKAHNMLFSTHFNYACAYALKVQKEEALAHLELAARYDPINTLTSMSDTQLDNIRQEAVFREIKKRLELVINRNRR